MGSQVIATISAMTKTLAITSIKESLDGQQFGRNHVRRFAVMTMISCGHTKIEPRFNS
jgi:hypothetical protein